jgi:hypothetical protein
MEEVIGSIPIRSTKNPSKISSLNTPFWRGESGIGLSQEVAENSLKLLRNLAAISRFVCRRPAGSRLTLQRWN